MSIVSDILLRATATVLKSDGRDRLLGKLRSRYGTGAGVVPDIVNYACYRIGRKRSLHPVTLIIEPTNTCNLTCKQCEVNRSMKRAKGVMSFETFERIIDMTPEVSRVSITAQGEPLLNPDITKMIRYAHSKGKFTKITTNATLLNEDKTNALLTSGLDIITFSLDGIGEVYEKVRGWDYKDVEEKIARFTKRNREAGRPIRTEINVVQFEDTAGATNEVLNRWSDSVDLITISQLCRGRGERRKPCLYLWRSIAVFWDGTVVPCCLDWDAHLKLDHFHGQRLGAVFNGPRMVELREKHIKGEFPFPCSVCNEFFS